MKIFNVYEAKTKLSQIIEATLNGEEVIIARSGKPLVRMIPYLKEGKRKLGTLKGKVKMAADFNDPLPEDLLADFYEVSS